MKENYETNNTTGKSLEPQYIDDHFYEDLDPDLIVPAYVIFSDHDDESRFLCGKMEICWCEDDSSHVKVFRAIREITFDSSGGEIIMTLEFHDETKLRLRCSTEALRFFLFNAENQTKVSKM